MSEAVTERIIRVRFQGCQWAGHRFVEKVYENALAHEMRKCGLLVEDQVNVELEVVATLGDVHVPQCRNDLRATGKPVCLPITSAGPQSKSAPAKFWSQEPSLSSPLIPLIRLKKGLAPRLPVQAITAFAGGTSIGSIATDIAESIKSRPISD